MKRLKKYLHNESIGSIRESDSSVVMHSKPKITLKSEDVFYDAIEDDATSPVSKPIDESPPIKVNSTIVSKSFYSTSKVKVIHQIIL
jgi:hypothetical protein